MVLSDESLEIVDSAMETTVDVSHAALRVKQRQWTAEKFNPEQFATMKGPNVNISIGQLHLEALRAVPPKQATDAALPAFVRESELRRSLMRAKRQAFRPMWEVAENRHETSVYRISKRTAVEVRDLARVHVEPSRGPMVAWAETSSHFVNGTGLAAVPASPPVRHAVVVGWSGQAEDWRAHELELANSSQVTMMP